MSAFDGFTQHKLLMLDKRGNKNAYYNIGDQISFTRLGSRKKITGNIKDLKGSTIVFQRFEVPIREITGLYIDEKTKWWLRFKIAQLSFFCGGMYLFADAVNNGKFREETLAIAAACVGVGLLAKAIFPHRIKINRKTKLRILLL
ncbi:MAG: hypothetical protein ACKO96_46825 [Flammeovirgaceae bacterium]